MDEILSDLVRSFGTRPERQEHRAWVDHPALLQHRFDDAELVKTFEYSGLQDLPKNDPTLPRELRALLRAPSRGWRYHVGLAAGFFLSLYFSAFTLVWIVGGITSPSDLMAASIVIFLPSSTVSMVAAANFGGAIERGIWHRFRLEIPGTRSRAIRRALDALHARPFVVRIGDVLVENLPSLSQLQAWEAELQKEMHDAKRRADELNRLIERMVEVSRDLGESTESRHTLNLKEAWAAEVQLQRRTKGLIDDIRERSSRIHKELAELRKRTELAALRAKADATLGRPREQAGLSIATELDLDLGELSAEVEQLRAELHEERLRARALTEVDASPPRG
ncbi:MAG: hypothetical protein EA397_11680 [Deltaproteobacteria bacterium]|nr:MAG: hypothetical protein EA397_11680 [Deltaproteobacteria bacterium]